MERIVALITEHGAAVVFIVAFLEQIGAPVPAIPVLIVAGALAAGTDLATIPQLLALTVAGALLADTIWYLLGGRYGYRVLGVLCRISLSPDSCVRKTESFFDRWGYFSLVFSKFVPGFSLIAPPLAGAVPRASFMKFLAYDFAGAVVWGGTALLIGVIFRNAIDRVIERLESFGGWAVMLLALALGLYLLFKWWERRRFYSKLRMARISAGDLRERMQLGTPLVVLDVRSRGAHKADPVTIPGARVVPPDEIEAALRDLDSRSEIVLYCT